MEPIRKVVDLALENKAADSLVPPVLSFFKAPIKKLLFRDSKASLRKKLVELTKQRDVLAEATSSNGHALKDIDKDIANIVKRLDEFVSLRDLVATKSWLFLLSGPVWLLHGLFLWALTGSLLELLEIAKSMKTPEGVSSDSGIFFLLFAVLALLFRGIADLASNSTEVSKQISLLRRVLLWYPPLRAKSWIWHGIFYLLVIMIISTSLLSIGGTFGFRQLISGVLAFGLPAACLSYFVNRGDRQRRKSDA
jgi:hypothetical protein